MIGYAPHQFRMYEFGIQDDGEDRPRPTTTIEGMMSEDEHERIFGPDLCITERMCMETYDRMGYTIRVTLTDVLACESQDVHQERVINAMLEGQGSEPLEHSQVERRARSCRETSQETAEFPMECAVRGMGPDEMDPGHELRKAREKGITLEDLLNPDEGD